MFVVEPVPFKAPGPVLRAHGAGGVHAVAGVQAEDVLQWEDRHVGDRVAAGADHAPVDVGVAGGQVAACEAAFGVAGGLPPAAHGVVVVGAGVGHAVALPVVR